MSIGRRTAGHEESDIPVLHLVVENLEALAEQDALTAGDERFLMKAGRILTGSNALAGESIRQMAQALRDSERRVRRVMNALLDKGILMKEEGVWYLHPEIAVAAPPDRIPPDVASLAERARCRLERSGIHLPVALRMGRPWGVWTEAERGAE